MYIKKFNIDREVIFYMDEQLKEHRDSYYDVIVLLQDKKDVLEALPTPEYQNFFPLMEGIISRLVEECMEYQTLGNDKEALEIIRELQEKIELCKSEVENVKKQLADDNLVNQATYSKRRLVFAKTTYGETFLERDLKDIPPEYYGKVLSALDFLEFGEMKSNKEKVRQLTNNKKMFGLYEIKEFKIRLIYRVLSNNIVYVMQARMKKDDNALIDQKEVINRSRTTSDEYRQLKKIVQDPTECDMLLQENEIICCKIRQKLEENKRSNKGEKK